DEVGILARMLKPFAAHGIDLIKIESRPLRGRPWEYVFYLDLKGHRRERRVEQALAEGGRGATRLKGLGSYPVAPPEGWWTCAPSSRRGSGPSLRMRPASPSRSSSASSASTT